MGNTPLQELQKPDAPHENTEIMNNTANGMKANMLLWSHVEKSDLNATKQVNTRGGFTAIDAYSQIKVATSIWGSMGTRWGLDALNYREIIEKDIIIQLTLSAVFKYPGGSFQLATDANYRDKRGNLVEDLRKKLLTDLMTKALSYLGFNADVFMGKFEDVKYMADLKKEANSSKYSRLYSTVLEDWVFPQGQFKGKKIEEISDKDYLENILNSASFKKEYGEAISNKIAERIQQLKDK